MATSGIDDTSTQVSYQNHLLIGLGGTGGAALCAFRNELFQRHRSMQPPGINIEFLYIDSSEADLQASGGWRHLGSSIALDNTQRLSITAPNLRAMIDNAPNYPSIANWIGPKNIWTNYLDSKQGLKTAGGQIRRLGRVLMASNIGAFNRAVSNLYHKLTTRKQTGGSGKEGVTFHILCGLAGGTGSGAVVDVAAQIGKFIKERSADAIDRVLIYALLPEGNPSGNRAQTYYHANGYAALLELNAMAVGSFLPHNVADMHGRPFQPGEIALFNGCYVLTNQTETGAVFDIDSLPGLIATFLYQKIVAIGNSGRWRSLVMQENAENGESSPEPRGNGSGVGEPPERSVRFLSFGVKRIAIPEQEIQEFLAYTFAQQTLLQLRFNNWTDAFGFVDQPKKADHSSYRTDALLQAFRLTDDHLELSSPILGTDLNLPWKPIDEFWQVFLSNVYDEATAEADKYQFIHELDVKCNESFDSGYRNVGVQAFYQRKLQTVAQEASEIAGLIEDHLFDEWLTGRVAMIDIVGSNEQDRPVRGILQVLREEIAERKAKALASVPAFEREVAEARETFNQIESEHNKVSSIDLLRKRPRLQSEAAQALEEYLILRTRRHGREYAARLCDQVLIELDRLHGQITATSAILQSCLEKVSKGIDERCQDRGPVDLSGGYVKFYDADNVRRVTERLKLNRDVQAAQALEVRGQVRQSITAPRPRFGDIAEQLNTQRLLDLLERTSFDQAQAAHDALGLKTHERLMGLRIVDQLLAKYQDAESRRRFAKTAISQASTLARINQTEVSNTAANPRPQTLVIRSMTVMGEGLNSAAALARGSDIDDLKQAIESASETPQQSFDFIETEGQPSELVFVSLVNLVPLRAIEHVSFLRRKYEDLIRNAGSGGSEALFLHIEGESGNFKSLFANTIAELREKACEPLLLGCALGLIKESPDPATGKAQLTYVQRDSFGVPVNTVKLGASLLEAHERVASGQTLTVLRGAVEDGLKAQRFSAFESKRELFVAVVQQMEPLLQACGNDTNHPIYRSFTVAYQSIQKRLGLT